MTKPSSSTLSWGILGTGNIAHAFASQLPLSRTGRLVAIGSRTPQTATSFAADYPGITAHGSYEVLLADPAVEAVYIATPHTSHAHWAILAARAGKAILCEKPLALNHAEAMAIIEAARQHGVFFMEAYMYRTHPQIAKAVELIRSGALGRLNLIRASFGFYAGENIESRLLSQTTGGGAILDIGGYAMSFARLIAGAVQDRPFAEPLSITATGHLHATTEVDLHASALLTFPDGLHAELSTGIDRPGDFGAILYGTDGSLRLPSPWVPEPTATLEWTRRDGTAESIEVTAPAPLYAMEADTVADHLAQGESPAMLHADSLGNIAAMERWRQEIGAIYVSERTGSLSPVLPPLRPAPATIHENLYRSIPRLERPLSRMVLGTDLNGAIIPQPSAFALFDYFLEHGGNTFDTAFIYGEGIGETVLGHWMAQRGVRKEVNLLAKGAHTPNCLPEKIGEQLSISLDRLQSDHAEIYLLHRDNPQIPAGEFVDALNREVNAGRIRLFGGSNWTLERIDEANAYAAAHGLQGFEAVSNQYSLARMVEPIWGGCVSSSDAASRQWLTRAQMPLFAWSSQSRGFFVRGAEDFLGDPELTRCWYAPDNFERLARVRELAARKGTLPIHLAAAWVLAQPSPLFALIGPWTLAEMASSFKAFEITLSPEELAWLNGEA